MDAPAHRLMPLPPRFAALLTRLTRIPGARYWAAAGLVLISVGVRLLASPYIAPGYGYTCFYPAVILSAYWLGGGPALMAAGLSTLVVYFFMGQAPFSFPIEGQGAVSSGFFVVSSLLLIHVLSTIRSRLDTLTTKHAQVEALAMGQAELFRDHAQRTTDHLQLISAILQLRARDETDPMVSRVLTNAASRTLVISRTHREFTGDGDRRIPFEAFARKLVEAASARGGIPAGRISIGGDACDVPLEQATSLGLVLLEYLNTLGAQRAAVSLSVTLEEDGRERALTLRVTDGDAPAPGDTPLFEAITEQLGGRLRITRGPSGGGVRISFPAEVQPAGDWNPVAGRLH